MLKSLVILVGPFYQSMMRCSVSYYSSYFGSSNRRLFMRQGYARSTGKVGVVLVTSGPGATNAVTGTDGR